jgi:hypothetical protein
MIELADSAHLLGRRDADFSEQASAQFQIKQVESSR